MFSPFYTENRPPIPACWHLFLQPLYGKLIIIPVTRFALVTDVHCFPAMQPKVITRIFPGLMATCIDIREEIVCIVSCFSIVYRLFFTPLLSIFEDALRKFPHASWIWLAGQGVIVRDGDTTRFELVRIGGKNLGPHRTGTTLLFLRFC